MQLMKLGVHPLLLAVGSERYTPFNPTKKPQELLTIQIVFWEQDKFHS